MAEWSINFEKFNNVRDLVDSGVNTKSDCERLNKVFIKNLEELAEILYQSSNDFYEEFQELINEYKADMELQSESDLDEYEQTFNYWLIQFYELCDNARIWLGL